MTQKINFPKTIMSNAFRQELENKNDLFLINLATADGFVLLQMGRKDQGIERDKMAAISSSLCSMSNSAAKALFGETRGSINIECGSGHIIFQHIDVDGHQAILTLCCKRNMALAEVRFIAKRLKGFIESNT